jgi:hypothetical protein
LIYDNIRQVIRKNKKKHVGASDKQLAEEFDLHLQEVMGRLSLEIGEKEESSGVGKGGCIIKAKTRLMDILVTKMGEYLRQHDGEDSQGILHSLSQQYNLFIN